MRRQESDNRLGIITFFRHCERSEAICLLLVSIKKLPRLQPRFS